MNASMSAAAPGPRAPGFTAPGLCTLGLCALALGACGLTPPAAYQRGHLARPDMAFVPDAAVQAMRTRDYVSKEAAAGGPAVAGGGCGCN